MVAWKPEDWYDYCDCTYFDDRQTGSVKHSPGRLIQIVRADGMNEFYGATHAWLMGPDGRTIERIAP